MFLETTKSRSKRVWMEGGGGGGGGSGIHYSLKKISPLFISLKFLVSH